MKVTLHVQSGSRKGERFEVPENGAIEIGSRARDVAFRDAVYMSAAHFKVKWGREGPVLRDLRSTNHTFLNGVSVDTAVLHAGDVIDAGEVKFRVEIEDTPTLQSSGKPLESLQRETSPLYAIVDAARNKKIYQMLCDCTEEYQSLYDGRAAEELEWQAPYLVRLAPDSVLLEDLVKLGWDDHWGVYLTCKSDVATLRKHLRHFLMVEMEGKFVYFRFYDPRVLRQFLPTCTADERKEFFGPIESYFTEGERAATLVRHAAGATADSDSASVGAARPKTR